MKSKIILPLLFTAAAAHFPTQPQAAPIAWWSFDEVQGNIVRDMTGNGHHGTIVGNVGTVPGVRGQALEFPGYRDAYVEVANEDGRLNLHRQLTIEAWVHRTDTGTLWDGIVSNGEGNRGYQLFHASRDQSLMLYLNTDTGGYGSVGGAYIPMDEWMHVAAVFDAEESVVRLYQNGRQTARQTYAGEITNHPGVVNIGRASGIFYHGFRGRLDEVKIHDHALTGQQILENYREVAESLPEPGPVPPVVFRNLEAVIDDGDVKLTFQSVDESPETASVTIHRNAHRRNDMMPGAREGEILFSGEMTPVEGNRFVYTDTATRLPGHSYHYWVTPDGGNFRVHPAKIRQYHPEIWWDPERIDAELERIAAAHADRVEIRTVGETVEGRPLRALVMGNPERQIVLVGAVHVSESGPELILPAVEGILQESPELLEKIGIAALPCVTLDERHRLLSTGYPRYLRKNANGVDLNRNFNAYWEFRVSDPNAETYQGTAPETEPEIHALMRLVTDANPVAVLSFHSVASLANAHFLFTRGAVEDENTEYIEQCGHVARLYARGMYGAMAGEYMLVEGFGSPGTLGSWVYKTFGVPSFDLELDRNPEPRKYAYGDAIPVELMREFQMRHQRGIENLIRGLAAEQPR